MSKFRTVSRRLLADARCYAAEPARRSVMRRELSREAFFRAAGHFTPSVEVEWPSGRFVLSTADRDISRVTFMSGPFGLAVLHRAARLLTEHTGAGIAGREVIEIGANIGTTTVPLITELEAHRVHAFEPSPESHRLLRQTVIANGLEERVVTYQMAVSDREGDLPFVVSARNAGSSRVATDQSSSNARVSATTLDALIERRGLDLGGVAMVWIDVEGHEAAVLAGAGRVISAGVPMVIEYWPPRLAETGMLEPLNRIIGTRFARMIDLHSDQGPVPTSSVSLFADRYRDGQTDLLLLPT